MSLPRPIVSCDAGVVVDLRAEDLGQPDRLPLGVRQLQRHRRLAGDRLDDADADQAQRARQVLGEVDDLRALDAGGRLDLVARDHRARATRRRPAPRRRSPSASSRSGARSSPASRASPSRLRPGAASSRSTCGSLVSAQLGEQRLLALLDDARRSSAPRPPAARSRSAGGPRCSWCSTSTTSSRSRSACSPRRMSSARSMRSTRRVAQRLDPGADALGQRAATRSAAPATMPATSAAIQNTPEPAKPSSFIAQRPEHVAEHAAGMAAGRPALPAGTGASIRATRWPPAAAPGRARTARPACAAGCAARRASPRSTRASAPSQARSADQHQPTRPNSRTGRTRGRRTRRRRRRPCCATRPPLPEVENAGSAALCVDQRQQRQQPERRRRRAARAGRASRRDAARGAGAHGAPSRV